MEFCIASKRGYRRPDRLVFRVTAPHLILARPPALCQAKVTKRNIRNPDGIIRNIRIADTNS